MKLVGHGDRCSCRLVAGLIGCSPKAIRFTFCQAILMNHWAMECNHGRQDGIVESRAKGESWHGFGPIDPVVAILVRNR